MSEQAMLPVYTPDQLEELAKDMLDTALIFTVSLQTFREYVAMVNKSIRSLGHKFSFKTDDNRVFYIQRD